MKEGMSKEGQVGGASLRRVHHGGTGMEAAFLGLCGSAGVYKRAEMRDCGARNRCGWGFGGFVEGRT